MRAFAAPLVCILFMVAAAGPVLAIDHPANGQLTRDVPVDYGTADYGYPASWSQGDLTFGGAYPDSAALMAPERYMLAGTTVPGNPEAGLPAWIDSVKGFCLDYHQRYGMLPAALTVDTVTALRETGWAQLSVDDQALPFNPLTGQPPRLDARDFAAGDFYVRVLTKDEMRYFAERRTALADAWFAGRYRDPQTGRTGQVNLESSVLYIRAYGAGGVIYEDLAYRLSEPDYSAPAVPTTYVKAAPSGISSQTKQDCAPSG